MNTQIKVLIIVTSHATLGSTGKPTGYYLPEVSHPYAALVAHGFSVDIASPAGGKAPLDQSSLDLKDPINRTFWEDKVARGKLENTLKLADIDPRVYRGIFYAGGHGTMWDFREDSASKRLAREIYEAGGVVAAVCHGPAALVDVKLSDGKYLVAGKKVGAFSDAEEKAIKLEGIVPFFVESALVEHGAIYSKADVWQQHVVVDGRLVTGQNPASASGVGEAMADVLQQVAR